MRCCCSIALVAFSLLPPAIAASADNSAPFYVRVVDSQSGRGVPLVELRTTNEIVFITDSQGIAVVDEPGLEGLEVFLHVKSHGYTFRRDGFGIAGKRVRVQRGGHAELSVERVNIAERLYRVTGGGIYRDSLLAGLDVPLKQPALNAQVFGSDSVQMVVYGNRLYWFWGDTTRPAYPLGNFHMTGATARLPRDGGLSPAVGIELEYFTGDDGFARGMAPMEGDGPTWLDGFVVLRDSEGREQMWATYAKIRGMLDVYRRGVCRWDDDQQQFVHHGDISLESPIFPAGHALRHTVDGQEYIYFAEPFPLIRMPAKPDAYADLGQYEAYTCALPGSTMEQLKLDRDQHGKLRYAWRRDAPVIDSVREDTLIKRGVLDPHEGRFLLRSVADGSPVVAHRGSVYFNRHRGCWVLIATQLGGTSPLGEVWYAEADAPEGPWRYAVKAATHDGYSFYNPKQHPELAEESDRLIYFEGTYTTLFSGNKHPTPRYEYNQVMYRLDLADDRLALPLPYYADQAEGPGAFRRPEFEKHELSLEPAFYACDRQRDGTAPMYRTIDADGQPRLSLQRGDNESPAFYVLPISDGQPAPQGCVALCEYVDAAGARFWTTEDSSAGENADRGQPLCYVWPAVPLSTGELP